MRMDYPILFLSAVKILTATVSICIAPPCAVLTGSLIQRPGATHPAHGGRDRRIERLQMAHGPVNTDDSPGG